MGFKAFRGQPFDHTHENKAFNKLYDLLESAWSKKDETVYLLGNFFVGGREIDALIIKESAIIVIDLKNYGGVVTFSENGHWLADEAIVKGGCSKNPFLQIRKNKFALVELLKSKAKSLTAKPNWGHVAGLALFSQPITFDKNAVPAKIASWFHVSDLDKAFRTVDSIVSSEITLPPRDIKAIIQWLEVTPFTPDGDMNTEVSPIENKSKPAKKLEQYPFEPLPGESSERKVWEWLKKAFKEDEAVIYYRYPIFTQQGNLMREPDILMLHREYGLWVFECKGCAVHNIHSIQGRDWHMNDWYAETIQPSAQAEDQMFALKNKFESNRDIRGKLAFNFRVALPEVQRKSWEKKGFHELPAAGGVLVYEDLTPAALKKHIQAAHQQPKITDDEWLLIQGVIGGVLPNPTVRSIPTGTPSTNPVRVIKHIEEKLKLLDQQQQKASFEIPDGPQRLRGLAGTGKTVVLAKKAVKMHIKHPEWTIGFVFFTQALYEQVKALITRYYQEMHPDHEQAEPNWNKLRVLHSWGGRSRNGFYYDLANKCGVRPKNLSVAINELKDQGESDTSPSKTFEYICESLQQDAGHIPTIYDALVIDEGQDLPPAFYQLAYQSLSKEKRIYWAYDEAQGIGSLIIPTARRAFGENEDGDSLINLQGAYVGGVMKAHNINTCYRTPNQLLMAAHAINMGLLRKEGTLQGVSRKDEWEKLGYVVEEGDFASVKNNVTVKRKKIAHPIDRSNFPLKEALGESLNLKVVQNGKEEHQWIAQQVANDIKLGMKPEDIMITALSGDYEKQYFNAMKKSLKQYGIDAYIAGVDGPPDVYRQAGHVTISNIFRAKGNEAWKVYACRFNYATCPLDWKQETELHKRNEAFVALTRARIWCVVTGVESPIFDELRQIVAQYPKLTFKAFNKKTLERIMDDEDEEQAIVA